MRYAIQLVLFGFTSALLAHGVSYTTLRNGYGVKLSYEDANPLDYADVQVFRPGESETEFQVGMTDENGVFMFNPDTAGMWIVKVSDGLGHGKIIQVPVGDINSSRTGESSMSSWQKAITGTGYILFVFSLWYFFAKKRQENRAHS